MNIHYAGSTKFLVADDSSDFAGRLVDRLGEIDGLDIIGPAHDGREAVKFFDQAHPHGVVLDLQMPPMNGLEVLAEIRERNSGCLVIMVTTHDYIELEDACLRAGADFFMNKSNDIDQLVDIVREFSEVRP